MRTRKRFTLLAVGILYIAMAQIVSAEVYYSTLVGTVRDTSGAVVPDAKVVATEVKTGVATAGLTDIQGEYRMTTLRPGEYTVTATKQGFKTRISSGVTLLVAQTARIDIPLEVGELSETVNVTGETPLVQTETAERGSIMEQREVEALPLNTRNIVELTFLTPGVAGSSSYDNELTPQVNGQSLWSNQFYVDGGGMTSGYLNGQVERITIDTVQEFKVETSNFTADKGLHSGAMVSIATKHGTNELHGTVFEFLRNDKLNARNFFDQSKAPLRYNQFGGTVGGPIIKNKLFFQGTYEGSRERRGITFNTTVPTLAERQGDFTPGTGAKDAAILNPFDVDPVTGLRRPFLNNRIPESLWNPIANKYLDLWPLPNSSGFPNYNFNAPSKNDYDRYALRVDYNISDKDSLFARIGHQHNPYLDPGPAAGLGVTGERNSANTLVVSWTHVLSARSFNEARFSYVRQHRVSYPSEFQGKNLAKEFGFENGDRLNEALYGCPWIILDGVDTATLCTGANYPTPNQTYYFSDDFNFKRGSHNFKTGLLHQRYYSHSTYGLTGGVLSTFDGRYTTQIGDFSGGQPFADFLLGALPGVRVNENFQDSPTRKNVWQMYFQDDWKVNSRLTLQLGLRYDMNLPSTTANGQAGAWLDGLEIRNGQTFVIPKNGEQALKDVLRGEPLGFPYRVSDNDWLSKPDWRNFGPRVGIAYRPFNDTKTVIRGGFGIYYDLFLYALFSDRNFGRPFFTFDSTPPRTEYFEPPPYKLGDAPLLSPGFKPGEPFRSGYTAADHNPDGRSDQWNITFQRDLGHNLALEVAYVGNRYTRFQDAYRGFNRTYPVGYTFRYDDGSTFTVKEDTPLLQRKKYPELQTGSSYFPIFHHTYHGAQVQLVKQMSEGLQFRAGYTRSSLKGISTDFQSATGADAFQDEWNLDKLSYHLPDDITNIFFATFVWQLPGQKMRGLSGAVIGGWQLGGIIRTQTGRRITVTETNPQFANAFFVTPVMLRDPNLPGSQRTLDRWFDTDAFQQPGLNQFGSDSAIYSVRADSIENFDITLSKFFRIREGHRLQVRAEFFNLFNHPTFGPPGADRGTATFGTISNAGRGREIQFGIKYQF